MKKIRIKMIMILILAFVLVSCKKENITEELYENGALAQNEIKETKEVNLILGEEENIKHTGIFVSYVQDHYYDYGLKLKINTTGDKAASDLLLANKAQFALISQADFANLISSGKGADLSAIASITQQNTMGIFSLKGAGIKNIKDLEGKKLLDINSSDKKVLEALMKDKGADFSKITFIKSEYTDNFASLVTEEADAVLAFAEQLEPHAKIFDTDINKILLSDLDENLNFYSSLVIASNEYIEKNKEDIEGFLSAIDKGYHYAVVNPAISTLSIDDYIENSDREILAESQIYLSKYYLDKDEQFGRIDVSRWDAFNVWLFEKGIIDKELKSGEGFTNDYLINIK